MKKRVVALGFFDGVHIGHGALLEKTRETAERIGASAAVLTYSRHPSAVVGKSCVRLINTTYERCVLIRELYGIDDIIVADFTPEYAAMPCERFFEETLLGSLGACHVVAGFDFRFGKSGAGDAETLRRLCAQRGIGCDIIDAVTVGGEPVSSSRIRRCIEMGEMENAAKLLGHNHCIISEISHGARLGGTMGFPTVNQELSKELLLPRFGVYASRVTFEGKSFGGITNIGTRPTVSEVSMPRAETNIFGFSGDLYGKVIKTELISFVRDEMRFENVGLLREQIARDVEAVKRLF
ncbi:MAG: riboflavin biosynthesis protein RibF [Oscillospiraceae bacterium]|nr:riboflavin biosynthesis protein RibF [Oscillospiraceae bacterium]